MLSPANEVSGKVMYLHVSVCPRGRGLIETPWTETPLTRDIPDRDPQDRGPPYGKERAVRILLECILVFDVFSFQHNHLVNLKRTYLKLSFLSVDDLMKVRREIMPAIRKNKEAEKSCTAYTEMLAG